jgi:similar to stage IV sporulation protein
VRYRHRYGILIGIVLSVALIALSGSVIWDIRIDGEHKLSESEVKSVLSDCGLDIGTRRRSLDIDALENRVLIRSDDIAWISVNIIGTVAEVEIRELTLTPEREELPTASNLVSGFDAKVVGFEKVKGNIAVEIGQRVRQGQLLVGGIYGDEDSGFRYTNPEGSVLGEVDRELRVEILRTEKQKVYTGEVKREKYLIFFEKRIKFFSNYRNLPMSCDKIEVEEYFHAPNGVEMPFGIYEVRYLEYQYEDIERDDEMLTRLADYRMDVLMSAELADAFLLRKRLQYEILDDRIVLRCRIKCVQNIASRLPVDI